MRKGMSAIDGVFACLTLVVIVITAAFWFRDVTGSKPDAAVEGNIIHPIYGSYPETVEFSQGMTLMPGQSTEIGVGIGLSVYMGYLPKLVYDDSVNGGFVKNNNGNFIEGYMYDKSFAPDKDVTFIQRELEPQIDNIYGYTFYFDSTNPREPVMRVSTDVAHEEFTFYERKKWKIIKRDGNYVLKYRRAK